MRIVVRMQHRLTLSQGPFVVVELIIFSSTNGGNSRPYRSKATRLRRHIARKIRYGYRAWRRDRLFRRCADYSINRTSRDARTRLSIFARVNMLRWKVRIAFQQHQRYDARFNQHDFPE